MRWLGIGLALAGVVASLTAWFSFQNVPVLIGGIAFMVIGLVVFLNGTRTVPK